MTAFFEKLNRYPIDWCVNCALTATNAKDVKEMMFCYILINYLRAAPLCTYGFEYAESDDSFVFKLKLKDWDNQTVSNLKRKKKYYRCLVPVLEEHLKNCEDNKIRQFTVSLDKKEMLVSIYIS